MTDQKAAFLLRPEGIKHQPKPVLPEAHVDIGLTAFIPKTYIPADRQRMDIYRRLTRCQDLETVDALQKDTIDARNRADAMVYNVEKTLKEHRTKVSDAEAKEIESAIEETKKVINENDPDKINAAVDRLTTASHKLAEAMYKASSAQTPPSGDGAGPGAETSQPGDSKKKDDVVDAEFVDVDDKK